MILFIRDTHHKVEQQIHSALTMLFVDIFLAHHEPEPVFFKLTLPFHLIDITVKLLDHLVNNTVQLLDLILTVYLY